MEKGDFAVDELPFGIFSTRDLNVLRRFGSRLEALARGDRLPVTEKEKKFVEDLDVRVFPGDEVTESAVVWMRYQGYKRLLADNNGCKSSDAFATASAGGFDDLDKIPF